MARLAGLAIILIVNFLFAIFAPKTIVGSRTSFTKHHPASFDSRDQVGVIMRVAVEAGVRIYNQLFWNNIEVKAVGVETILSGHHDDCPFADARARRTANNSNARTIERHPLFAYSDRRAAHGARRVVDIEPVTAGRVTIFLKFT